MNPRLRGRSRDTEQGQTMAEYAMVLAVITLAILVGFQTLGNTAAGALDEVTAYF